MIPSSVIKLLDKYRCLMFGIYGKKTHISAMFSSLNCELFREIILKLLNNGTVSNIAETPISLILLLPKYNSWRWECHCKT